MRAGARVAAAVMLATMPGCATDSGFGSDLDPAFAAYDGCPVWAPDANAFAFTRDGTVVIAGRNGDSLARLGKYDAVLGWLSDPARVVVTRRRAVLAVHRRPPHRATRMLLLRRGEQPLTLSPDAQFLAVEAAGDPSELRVVRVRDGARIMLARGSYSGSGFAARAPRIVFVTDRGVTVRDLRTGDDAVIGSGYLGDLPALSSDGREVAFARASGGDANQIHLARLGPTLTVVETRVLTRKGDAENTEPVFWPGDARVVYQHGGDLRVVDTDGNDDRRLTDAGGFGDYCPAISPDGERIAYTRGQSGLASASSALIVMAADGSGKRVAS